MYVLVEWDEENRGDSGDVRITVFCVVGSPILGAEVVALSESEL
jgi:hypothetical protein